MYELLFAQIAQCGTNWLIADGASLPDDCVAEFSEMNEAAIVKVATPEYFKDALCFGTHRSFDC
jgi:hypothetical protein